MSRPRCGWCGDDPLYKAYHDEEWGVPEHGDGMLFEMLILEGAQAGLSWITILRKRIAYRRAFAGFDVAKVARFDAARHLALAADAGIVRNRLKIAAATTNARAFLAVQDEFDSFDAYLWRFVDGEAQQHHYKLQSQVPATSKESEAMSKDLRKRGFKFVGSTICYAYMQSIGMVNDHIDSCFRQPECATASHR